MSVQRWTTTLSEARYRMDDGPFVLYADHARIVAEATAEARAAERRHWEARFRNAEQAHAAALAAVERLPGHTAHAYIETSDWSGGQSAQVRFQQSEQGRWVDKGDVLTLLGNAAAAPRILTADDPEPAVGSVVLLAVGNEAVQRSALGWQGYAMHTMQWAEMFRFGPVTLIHDGEATPQVKPCSTCGEPVAYLTARPGWAGGWLHHPARPLDGHPAAIDGEAGR